MIENDRIAMISLRKPDRLIRAIEGIIRVLCKIMHADVDFVPYLHLCDIVPIAVHCPICKSIFYVRGDTHNETIITCPECMRVCTIFTDGTMVQFVSGVLPSLASEWMKH